MSSARARPPKDCGPEQPFAPYFADVLPESHREALRWACVTYLEECYDALRSTPAGSDFRETAIADHLPQRYDSCYDGLFAKEWTTTIAVVGWKLAQPGKPQLACVAEELALYALMREAIAQLDMHDQRPRRPSPASASIGVVGLPRRERPVFDIDRPNEAVARDPARWRGLLCLLLFGARTTSTRCISSACRPS